MKKLIISTLVILLLVITITSVTFAWFTYVERKSVAAFEAGELAITMKANDANLDFDILVDDIAFIDYENEVILDKYQTFNQMASSVRIDIKTDINAPLSKHLISIDETNLIPGLMYILIYEGINLENPNLITTDYHTYFNQVIAGYLTKEDQLVALAAHNEQVLNFMYEQVLDAEDEMTFQMVMWGDYDSLTNPETYLDESFILSLTVDSINDKGDITP